MHPSPGFPSTPKTGQGIYLFSIQVMVGNEKLVDSGVAAIWWCNLTMEGIMHGKNENRSSKSPVEDGILSLTGSNRKKRKRPLGNGLGPDCLSPWSLGS